jgi:hypothetical protein
MGKSGGKLAKTRGTTFEYRVRNWFKRCGFKALRVPASGASQAMKGDIEVELHDGSKMYIEAKRRTNGYSELMGWIRESKSKGVYTIVLGVGREKPLVVVEIDRFIELLKSAEKNQGE